MTAPCIFCAVISGEIPSVAVWEDETVYAFMDVNPAADGHLLVVPKRHSSDLLEILDEDLVAVTLVARRIARSVTSDLGADGVNVLNNCGPGAWQSVFHFHLHVIPRYADKTKDRLTLPWAGDVSGDRVTIEHIGRLLREVLAAEP